MSADIYHALRKLQIILLSCKYFHIRMYTMHNYIAKFISYMLQKLIDDEQLDIYII